MRIKNLKLYTLLLFILCLTRLQAQEATPATGGNASGSGGSVSYSIGQLVYNTNSGINGSVVQGVQQPFEISVVTGIKEVIGITLLCSVYPNPTTNFLTLKVENLKLSTLTFQLLDINGKLLENKTIVNNETSIDMSNFAATSYFLKVIDNNKEVKTFKIIKSQ
jgi:hypothetical protein